MIDAILASVRDTAQLLRLGESNGEVGSSNTFGDQQLKVSAFKPPPPLQAFFFGVKIS